VRSAQPPHAIAESAVGAAPIACAVLVLGCQLRVVERSSCHSPLLSQCPWRPGGLRDTSDAPPPMSKLYGMVSDVGHGDEEKLRL
jgi:hypothetical protein